MSPLTAKVLYNRGIRSVEEAERFLGASLDHMRSPFLFQDMQKAVERISQAIHDREKVLVYGDYDVDGLTSAAVLIHFLRAAGLNPLYHVPDRLNEGYGFHAENIPAFHQQGVQLIITVDCGVSDADTVRLAGRYGINVIVTDHHECPPNLPPALAVLNPKVPESNFPFRDLAGVGVAFYLVVALRMHLRESGIWRKDTQPNLLQYLDLVALGTLADMVPLQEENRLFVKHGLRMITRADRPGVMVLKEQAGIEGPVNQTRPVVYRIIPRINAPGRMGCAMDALDILLCGSLKQARRIAEVLETRNVQRRSVEDRVYREAFDLARQQLEERDRCALVLWADGWHKGILGIVASRIAREVLRPVVLVSFMGDQGKGSIRSVENVKIMNAVLACNSFLEDFGGHQMAAGISIKRENIEDFGNAFEKAVLECSAMEEGMGDRLVLDLWVEDPKDLDKAVTCEIQRLAPFGNGNEEPVMGMRNMRVLKKDIVGDNHLKMTLGRDAVHFEAIGFGMGQKGILESRHPLWNVAFTPQIDSWRGRERMSLRIIDIQPS